MVVDQDARNKAIQDTHYLTYVEMLSIWLTLGNELEGTKKGSMLYTRRTFTI